jgi:hypothetical protein
MLPLPQYEVRLHDVSMLHQTVVQPQPQLSLGVCVKGGSIYVTRTGTVSIAGEGEIVNVNVKSA